MTTLQLKTNGEPFEIELHDGLQVTIDEGKLTVKRSPSDQPYVPPYTQPYVPYVPAYPYYPTITWGTGNVCVSDRSDSFTVAPIQ